MSKSKKRTTVKISSVTQKSAARETPKPKIDMSAERQRMISDAAYFLAEQRGFGSGDELGDWLQAESQINASVTQKGE